jgi:hypothetical protein
MNEYAKWRIQQETAPFGAVNLIGAEKRNELVVLTPIMLRRS